MDIASYFVLIYRLLGDKFEDPCRVDIYNINDYELYHKENDNYILVYKTSKV